MNLKNSLQYWFLFIPCLFTFNIVQALPERGVFEGKITKSYDYLIHFPETYSADGTPVGLLLFLHGSGERGCDVEQIKKWGPARIIEEKTMDFPVVVISPQCPLGETWDARLLKLLIEDVTERYRIDKNRIYLSGLSLGGKGTWALASLMADQLAAIVPVCGRTDISRVQTYEDLPIWVFHGAMDQIVPLNESTEMVNKLNEIGANVKFTVYPEADHVETWVLTYQNPNMWEWLWSQNLGNRQNQKK